MTDRTINKIISKSPNLQESLLDLTSDSVSPGNLLLNETAHNNEGEGIVGEMPEGGTSDYDALSNRPQINSNLLTGNKTGGQLGLQNKNLDSPIVIGGQTANTVEGALSALNGKKADIVGGKVPVNELPVYVGIGGSTLPMGGIVPEASAGDEDKYLRSDGTWAKPAGGGGGVSDYDDLTNRPRVNGTTLSGDKTGTQLGLQNIVLSSALSIGGQTITEVEPALRALNENSSAKDNFIGTKQEWEALTPQEQAKYNTMDFLGDSSSGGGGHTIVNSSGTEMTQRSKLQFEGAIVSDDETNDATVVETVNPVEYEEDIYGVNLLNVTAITQTINGVTFTVDNSAGTITANGTASANVDFQFVKNAQIKNILKVGESYIFTTELQGGATGNITLRYNENGTTKYVVFSTGVFTATQAMIDNGIITWWVNNGQAVSNVVSKPMLRKSTIQDDTYRPYNQQSIQHQLTDQTNVLGAKNLLQNTATSQTINSVVFTVNSDNKTVNVTRPAEQTAIAAKDLYVVSDKDYKLLAGKTLLMTGCPSGGSSDTYYLECYYNDGTGHYLRDIGDGLTITLPVTKPTTIKFLIGIKVASVIPSGGLTFKPMLRLASDPDNTYVPYAMTNRELTKKVNALPREVFVTTDTRTTTTNDANTLPCGFTRMNNKNSNLPTDGTGGNLWYDILTVRQSNDPSKETWGYGFQLAVQTTSTSTMGDTYVRAVNGGANPTWSEWKKLN